LSKKDLWWVAAFGLVGGLLGAGLIYLIASRPRGQTVQLRPAPSPAPIQVYVTGGVKQPGVYALPPDSRVQAAIEAAGGAAAEADLAYVNLAARLEDGDQLYIPLIAPTLAPEVVIEGGSRGSALPGLVATATPQAGILAPTQAGLININTANQEQLESLPGIGPKTAEKIIAYRNEHGPFQSIEAILDVSGIGPATFEEIKTLITVGQPARPN
jgi:competence protein ComEA